jgi:opacity protein-like surface antigen
MRLAVSLALASLAVTAAAAPALAQSPGAAPAATARTGWNVGFGVGGGNLSCDGQGCDGVTEAGSGNLHVGYMSRPRLAAVFDLWGMAHTENQLTVAHTIGTVGLRYWLAPRLWLQGGVGGAHASFHYKGALVDVSNRTESVLGVMGAVGFELIDRPDFAIDIQLRGGTGFYRDNDAKAHNEALTVGFTWF